MTVYTYGTRLAESLLPPDAILPMIGERERANLVVQLAQFFYMFIYLFMSISGRCTYRNVLRTSKYALVGSRERDTCRHTVMFSK